MPKLVLPNAADFQPNGIEVEIKSPLLDLGEVVEWCLNYLGFVPDVYLIPKTVSVSNVTHVFCFEIPSEAVLFKTRWG
jgi:hypothetical protein